MSELELVVIGEAEFKVKLGKLAAAVRGKMLEDALRAGALQIEGPAKQKAPVRTGNLKRSIHIETSSTDTSAEARIGTNLVYAAVQEFGGTISPKSKAYLVFKTPDGSWHSVKSVHVPAHPYLRPAFDENKDTAVKEVGQVLELLITKAAT